MIEINNVSKYYDKNQVLSAITFCVKNGSITGIAGSNGAGKSTLLRLAAGIGQPEEGTIQINGSSPYGNREVKRLCGYIPDHPVFFQGASLKEMANYYCNLYPSWDQSYFLQCKNAFELDSDSTLSKLSKGKQRQAAIALTFSTRPQYLLLDESFDGLDPVMSKFVKGMLIDLVSKENTAVMLASHNINEIDEVCDSLCFLHQGKQIMAEELEELKQRFFRVQLIPREENLDGLYQELSVKQEIRRRGKGVEFLAEGKEEEIRAKIQSKQPFVFELLPATLEELVIYNMEVLGYEIEEFK